MSTAVATSLWKIEDDLIALLDSVEACPDDLVPELQEKIEAYLGAEAAKVDQVAHVLQALDWEQRCAADEIARLQERKKAAKAAQDRLEQYVCRVIKARGGKPLKGNTNTLSVRASDAVVLTGDVPPLKYCRVLIVMPGEAWEALPIEVNHLIQTSSSIDFAPEKTAIKKALKAGEEVPGADLEWRDNLQRR